MSQSPLKRTTLSLGKPKPPPEPEEDKAIDIGVFDVRLPCRKFSVTHKVTKEADLSLTLEFLLRLVHAADGIPEEDVAAFFGFDHREFSFVVGEAESKGYVSRRDGRLWIMDAGRNLFRADEEVPQIYKVEQEIERVGFDLLAFAPTDPDSMNDFDRALPELEPYDPRAFAEPSIRVRERFRHFFRQFKTSTDGNGRFRELYSIDSVKAEDRYSCVVTIVARSSSLNPGAPIANLERWMSGLDLAERSAVEDAAARHLAKLRISRQPTDADAYGCLLDLAPEYLREYARRDGFAVERFFKETVKRAGEFRQDRMTVGIVGSLLTEGNLPRLVKAAELTAQAFKSRASADADAGGGSPQPSVGGLVWVVPGTPGWGETRVLPNVLEELAKNHPESAGPDASEADFITLAVTAGRPRRHIEQAFSHLLEGPEAPMFPGRLEILLLPGRVAAVLVHAPVGAAEAVAVPLGVLSFDPDVVERVTAFVGNRIFSISNPHWQRIPMEVWQAAKAMFGIAETG